MRTAAAWIAALSLGAAPAWAETVEMKDGTRLQGRLVRHGDYLIVSGGGEPRILDEILVSRVSTAPDSRVEIFLDLAEGEEPAPSRIHVFPSAKAKARFLLEAGSNPKIPQDAAERARRELRGMGAAAHEELFSCVVPGADPARISLALDCLAGADLPGLEKRLTEVALMSRTQGTCRRAAEEIKKRYGKTPHRVLQAITDPESAFATVRAGADVVAVTRDPEGIAALVTAIRTRGIRVTRGPRQPFIRFVRVGWTDEEPLLKDPEPRLLFHLVAVLQEISGTYFDNVQDILDWADAELKPAP